MQPTTSNWTRMGKSKFPPRNLNLAHRGWVSYMGHEHWRCNWLHGFRSHQPFCINAIRNAIEERYRAEMRENATWGRPRHAETDTHTENSILNNRSIPMSLGCTSEPYFHEIHLYLLYLDYFGRICSCNQVTSKKAKNLMEYRI